METIDTDQIKKIADYAIKLSRNEPDHFRTPVDAARHILRSDYGLYNFSKSLSAVARHLNQRSQAKRKKSALARTPSTSSDIEYDEWRKKLPTFLKSSKAKREADRLAFQRRDHLVEDLN